MHWLVVAVALLAACRGGKPARKDAGPAGPALSVSAVPKLPLSPDGDAELASIDKAVELARGEPRKLIPALLERAAIRGRVEDYLDAVKQSAVLVDQAPADGDAWHLRVQALLRVHEFAGARDALAKLKPLVHPSRLVELEIVLADATGDSERAIVMRADVAKVFPSPANLTAWAASLAQVGLTDEAIAIIPKAAAAVRDNPPQLIAWLLFQWGRCYELKGELATAREFFAAAHARLPGYVEATAHLANAMIATGDHVGAKQLVEAVLAAESARDPKASPHPELLSVAVVVGHAGVPAARAEWERYVAALPLAFADHAARFYLGVGRDPQRALELARINFDNRKTHEARALVVESALALGDAAAACAVVDPLVISGTRAQRFMAWRALSRCDRTADASRLARELGITP